MTPSDPKEALERLKRLERQFQLWADDEVDSSVLLLDALAGAMPYLRTLIAKQEGLEREVERLKQARAEQERLIGEYQPRAVTAEAKFAALEMDYLTAKGEMEQARDEIERLRVSEAKLSALEERVEKARALLQRPGYVMGTMDALRALLPTVPVEGS